MQQKLQQQTQKQAKEAKSCMKVQYGKAVEHNRQNVFKSHTNPENQTCHNFVISNKRKTFEKLDRKLLENVKEFGNKGLSFFVFFFNVLVLYILLYL